MKTTTIKKVCVITGSRAEYGLMKRLIKLIENSSKLNLQLIVTGSHLSKKFGETYKEIEQDGFKISHKINLKLVSDTSLSVIKSSSIALVGLGSAYSSLKPDLVIVLGDRYEILSAVIAAMFFKIPIAHLHGGELTEGAFDDAIRHSITKFSHIHFVANDIYKKRVIQLGENPNSVFNVGGMGVDAIKNINILSKAKLEKSLNIKFKKKNLLVTFHPVTLEENTSKNQMIELLDALSDFSDAMIIFTMPNADPDNRIIFKLIKEFVSKNKNSYYFNSLGQLLYLSCLAHVDAVVGNSSSGLIEAPTFKKATINIGTRQKGRIKSKSIIDCKPLCDDIKNSIKKSFSDNFKRSLASAKNPYGEGGASEKIVKIIENLNLNNIIYKKFYDL